jgi:hypothetical protein
LVPERRLQAAEMQQVVWVAGRACLGRWRFACVFDVYVFGLGPGGLVGPPRSKGGNALYNKAPVEIGFGSGKVGVGCRIKWRL